jgi:uncharacterized membrane protein
MADTTTDNGKTAAIVSYITIIGWLVSYFSLNKPKTSLASYHMRQNLLLYIIAIAFQILNAVIASIVPMLSLVLSLVGIGFLVLWILGLIAAVNGEEKPMPLIGEKAQELFKNI